MGLINLEEPYKPKAAKTSILQPKIEPHSVLRKPWFKNKIVSKDGWSISFSGSSWRIDKYDYREDGRHLVLSGEGTCRIMEIFIPTKLAWDAPLNEELDDQTRIRVLENITSALQWAGFSVGFFFE